MIVSWDYTSELASGGVERENQPGKVNTVGKSLPNDLHIFWYFVLILQFVLIDSYYL